MPRPESNSASTCVRTVHRTKHSVHPAFCSLLALLFFCASVSALEPTTPLAGYGRQSWVMENGLPQNTVQALAQTRDGFIWLGTEVGLVRFDGNTFTILDQKSKPSLPGNDVRYLLADDGSLWIGTTDGVAQLHDGRVSIFNTSNGLPGNRIQSLAQKPNGAVIVQTDAGPALISSGRVESSL